MVDGQGRWGKHKREETRIHTSACEDTHSHTHKCLPKTFPGCSPPSLCLLTHIPAWLCHWNSAGAAAATVDLILMGLRACHWKTTWICWHARYHILLLPVFLFLSVFPAVFLFPYLSLDTPSSLTAPSPGPVYWLLPSPQVLISTICWSRSVFWAQILSLSVLLTLPILRPGLHNSDDSVGTCCICSPLSGHIWAQLTGVKPVFCFKPQPVQQIGLP